MIKFSLGFESFCFIVGALLATSVMVNNGHGSSLAFSFDSATTTVASSTTIRRSGGCENRSIKLPHSHRYDWSISSVADDGSVTSSSSSSRTATPNPNTELAVHTVQGIRCREVTNELPVIGTVVVLEATADAQEELVEECLELEDDDVDTNENGQEPQKRIAEGDPYGAVLWPAAWAVSNYLLSEPDLRDHLKSWSILELGTGTGLVSIASAMGGAKRVLATDYEPLALELTRYAADHMNHGLVSSHRIETRLLDLCALQDQPLPLQAEDGTDRVDLVVAADIMYEPKTGIAMAHRAVEALRQNCRVIVGDSPGRPGRPAFLQTLRELGVDEGVDFVETIGKTCSGPRHDLICGKGSTSVSETPQELAVALLDLKPSMLSTR